MLKCQGLNIISTSLWIASSKSTSTVEPLQLLDVPYFSLLKNQHSSHNWFTLTIDSCQVLWFINKNNNDSPPPSRLSFYILFRPVNITALCKLNSTSPNGVQVRIFQYCFETDFIRMDKNRLVHSLWHLVSNKTGFVFFYLRGKVYNTMR